MATLQLNTGATIPGIALGCGANHTPAAMAAAKNWIATALKAGYRHFDTALLYGTEGFLGEAIRESGIPREDIFITTKLPWHHGAYVERSFQESLHNLGVDYVDLYLMHCPQTVKYPTGYEIPTNEDGAKTIFSFTIDEDGPGYLDIWKSMEKVYSSGRAKAIGVSNFSVKLLEELLKIATVVPAVDQVEMSPYLTQPKLLEYCKSKNIVVEAYSPSGREEVRSDPTIVTLAEKYKVSPTQIIMSWHVMRGVIPIPKSTNAERQKENITLISLSKEDFDKVTALDRNHRVISKFDDNDLFLGWTKEQWGWE